jgi:AraC-like DNA-binding protein
MADRSLVSTQILLPIVERLRLRGVRAAPLLQAVGIERDRLSDVNHFVPLVSYVRFFEAAAEAVRDPHFGLDCGRGIDSGSLGAISFLFMSAPNLRDAFRGLTQYLAALQTGTRDGLEVRGDEAMFHYQIADDRIAPRRQDAEYSMSATSHLISKYLDRGFVPREVQFEHDRVGAHATYENFFGCEVFFGQPTNSISFDADHLNVAAPALSDKLYPIIAAHLEERIERRAPNVSVKEQVANLLDIDAIGRGRTISDVAAKLGVSESTLFRKLKAEGTSFILILTEKRMSIARRLLAHTDMPISEIALAVGYSENASFTRAFKAWCEVTPERYRQARHSDA